MTGPRIALQALVVVLVAVAPAALVAPSRAQTPEDLRLYVVTVDGLDPAEVTSALMPRLAALRAESTWYEQGRAVLPAETLPNHVAMMTGVLPERNGVVANNLWDDREPEVESRMPETPDDLVGDTLYTALERDCVDGISTASVQAKDYTVGVFRGQPDYHFDPGVFIPVSGSVPDVTTMSTFLDEVVASPDLPVPQFAHLSLGDVDRVGHSDPTGNTGVPVARRAAMLDTDALIGRLIDELQGSGLWEDTVLLVNSDHSMDWSLPTAGVDLAVAYEAAGLRVGTDVAADDVWTVENGGAQLVYVHDPAAVEDVADVTRAVAGVDSVVTDATDPSRADYGQTSTLSGDLLVFAEDGARFSDAQGSNPLPGNHSHAVTQPSVLMVGGGHPVVRDGGRSIGGDPVYDPDRAAPLPLTSGPGNLSVAPTVATILGLAGPEGGYDGEPLLEALDAGVLAELPRRCASDGPEPAPDPDADPDLDPDPGPDGPPPSPEARDDPTPTPTAAATPTASPFPLGPVTVERDAGEDRIATAVEISSRRAPGGPLAVVASAADFPDALSAGPVAAAAGAPVLLAWPDTLPDRTAAELRRLDPDRVLVIGGTTAVSAEVAAAVGDAIGTPAAVDRVGGPDRFATAALLSADAAGTGGTVYVATGATFPDALTGGVAAAADDATILLTGPDELPAATADELRRMEPGEVVVLGGPDAVSPDVMTAVGDASGAVVERRAGRDRYETAVAISQSLTGANRAPSVHVATGTDFPDALADVPQAAAERAPILLVTRDEAPPATLDEIARLRPDRIVVLGGEEAVSTAVEDDVAAAARP